MAKVISLYINSNYKYNKYRGISNKIYAKIMNIRLKPVSEQVLGEEHIGFRKERSTCCI